MIGSIDVINERISSLNNELIEYECTSKLAIDSQASHNKEVLALSKNKSPWRTTRSARGRQDFWNDFLRQLCLMFFYPLGREKLLLLHTINTT